MTFSILDGHGKPADYARKAAELGQPALAITDHGSLGGAYQHYEECLQHGIKPIIGIEAYIAPSDRTDRTPISSFSGSGKYGHITLLATGSEGLRNLYRLQSHAYSSGFYGKPRIDLSLLGEYSRGIIATTGCSSGHVATYLGKGVGEPNYGEARQFAHDLVSILGKENVFVEVMNHDIKESDLDEARLNRDLIEFARKEKFHLVATNDAHYCEPEDHDIQQALLCVSTQDVLSNPNRFQFNGTGFYLRSSTEMESLDLPQEAISNTLLIAEQVSDYDEAFAHKLRMPKFVIPDDWDEDAAERDLVQWEV